MMSILGLLKKQNAVLLTILFVAFLFLVFSCNDNDDIIMNPPKPVTSPLCVPAWSPDGQWIAIAVMAGDVRTPCGIYLVRPDGSDLHMLFSFGDYVPVLDVCWSPDGQWLAFNAYAEIYKIRADATSLTRLTFNSYNFNCTWSNSDTLIAFEHITGDNPGAWIIDKNGSNMRPFIRLGGHLDFALGDSLYYSISLGNNQGKLAFLSLSDSTERIIINVEYGKPYTTYYDPDVSPDGDYIAFRLDTQIRLMSTQNGQITTLKYNNGGFPSWSPDGTKMAYCEARFDPAIGVIRVMNRDGTDDTVIVDWNQYISE